MAVTEDFFAGVIEGFYGRPWSQEQRRTLLPRMASWGLNTYFYCRKDDLKHRAIWRQPYDDQELARLEELIRLCEHHGLRFIYGLSPGLDIEFSRPEESQAILNRLKQLMDVGARHFALLFDDLPGRLSEADETAFDSLAQAQCAVTQTVFEWLRKKIPDSRMLFCPTPYCDRMDRWNLGGAGYLDDIGRFLPQGIDCLWTGPEIVSHRIDAESIRALTKRIGRAPVIWDNLHANDYDLRRVYCGPYSGRPADTIRSVAGIMANANNEFELNYVPFRTMARCLNSPDDYEPRAAFVEAIREWHTHYGSVRRELSVDDLQLLADCYYLPATEGEEAVELKELVRQLLQTPPDTWKDGWKRFLEWHRRIECLFETLTELHDRELFYAWSRRVWELREEMDLIRDVLTRLRAGEDPDRSG